ncbi:MAG: efflux RND transporter periplasmic adaptor subunit [Chloroflexi bacterium]|nr:efflux RND transporter periplasmic adaptor subunit [Chloroflexota bacterium]
MKRFCWTILLTSALILTGCGNPSNITVSATSSAANVSAPTQAPNPGSATASVNVVPAQESNLSFLLSATVKEIDVKEGDQVKAGQTLMVLNTPDLENAVTAAEANVQAQQAIVNLRNYPYKRIFKDGQIVYVKAFIEFRQQAQAELDVAQAALDVAKYKLAQATLTAPYDGTIVAINAKAGELVQPGEVVAVIGTLNHLQIQTTDLSEKNIAHVQVGQTATVQLKAFNQGLSGKVTAIAPMGKPYNGDIVYKVTIELDSPPSNLMWGMSGNVTIQTQQ